MNASLTLACLIAAGVGLVVQNTLMVRITQSASTILIAMLLNSLVGIVIFVTMLLLRQGVAGFQELALKWFTEFGHLNRGDMLTSEQHRCHNEKKKFQRRV